MPQVIPTAAALGADITGIDLSKPLSDRAFGTIHQAWMDNLVLRFRGQSLTDDQLLAFSRNFGPLDRNPRHAKSEHRQI